MCDLEKEEEVCEKRGRICIIGHGCSGATTLINAIRGKYPDINLDDVEVRIVTNDMITETNNCVVSLNPIPDLESLILSSDEKIYKEEIPLLEKNFNFPSKRSSRKGRNRRWWDER